MERLKMSVIYVVVGLVGLLPLLGLGFVFTNGVWNTSFTEYLDLLLRLGFWIGIVSLLIWAWLKEKKTTL